MKSIEDELKIEEPEIQAGFNKSIEDELSIHDAPAEPLPEHDIQNYEGSLSGAGMEDNNENYADAGKEHSERMSKLYRAHKQKISMDKWLQKSMGLDNKTFGRYTEARAYAINGSIFSMKKQYDDAIEMYKKAVATYPDANHFVYHLANSLKMKGDYHAAKNYYDKVLRRNIWHIPARIRRWSVKKRINK